MRADILIENGRVIDTVQKIDEVRDIAVLNGVIVDPAEVDSAAETVDAAGCIVTAGLIDMHAHFASCVSEIAVHPEAAFFPTGVTTAVDAGTTGTATWPAFRAQLAECRVNTRAMLHCNVSGITTIRYHEDHDPRTFDEDGMLRAFNENRDKLIAVKVRISRGVVGGHGMAPFMRAKEIARRAGVALACHVTDPPIRADELADLFDAGDFYIHAFHGVGNTIIGEDGHVLPGVWRARERGVIFDSASGRTHFSFDTARRALADGFMPDVISTDVVTFGLYQTRKMFSLPFQMSRFIALGAPLPAIIACVTQNPARVLGGERELGSLAVGTTADIAVHRPVNKKTVFLDAVENEIEGNVLLKTEMTVRRGEIVFRQIDF